MSFRLVLTVVLSAGLTSPSQAGTIYVDDDNCPGPGSGTQADPYCSMQTAIDNAVDTDEIVVAPGTYFETINFLGKAVWLHSSDGPEVTIIDGTGYLHVVQCVSGEGPDTVLDGFTITGGNANSADYPNNLGGGMYIEYCSPTVTNCTFSGNTALYYGGGMYNDFASPTVSACEFIGNTASGGGGMMNRHSSAPTVSDCDFTGNTASEGGGMYNGGSSPTVIRCSFAGNSASHDGGGMYNGNSSATVANCTFSGNLADRDGGGIRNHGGNPSVENCTFVGNMVDHDGGGIHDSWSSLTLIDCTFTTNTALDDGGGACSAEHSSPTVTGCTFAENQAQSGGGLQIESWHPPGATVAHCTFVSNIAETDGGGFVLSWTPAVITDCVFSGNVAGDKGGGLYSLAPLNFTTVSNSGFFGNQAAEGGGWHNGFGSPRITNCTFHANSAASFGGGMFNVYFFNNSVTNCVFTENAAAIGGAGVFNLGSWPMYVNCTFTGNEATVEGGAMKSEALNSDTPSLLLLTNCIVWGDSPDEFEQDTASETTVLFSDVQGGWPGPGNVDADPMFTDPISDYRLQSGSPCIDAGHNNAIAGLADTDFDGNPRFADDPATDDTGCGIPVVVDMGAYEYQGEPADVTFADLDGDGVVRIADLLILTGCLGSDDPQCCTADLDLDGMVGMSDRWLLLDMLIQSIPDP